VVKHILPMHTGPVHDTVLSSGMGGGHVSSQYSEGTVNIIPVDWPVNVLKPYH